MLLNINILKLSSNRIISRLNPGVHCAISRAKTLIDQHPTYKIPTTAEHNFDGKFKVSREICDLMNSIKIEHIDEGKTYVKLTHSRTHLSYFTVS